ncbi:hypothetical protein [Deinococcus planocerae]|uniref:hypothetical protein n=1 Tax=Deinococcus planocerae TaxID=1737569 RepID=UPI0015E0FE71|nr:hypothetical protein [Deinococcus planocerae]
MSDDAHARANAEQLRMLREALVPPEPAGDGAQTTPETGGEPSSAPAPGPSPRATS